MHCVSVNAPVEWPTCNIYPLADLHIGDPHCDRGAIERLLNRIQDDPYGLVLLNGDLLNTAVKSGVSDVYGETLKPIDQIVALVTLLTPIRDRIIGATTGNHESRVYRNDGIDIMRLVCRELGIEDKYHPDGVYIFLRVGRGNPHGRHMERSPRQLFTLYVTHGSGGGRKEGAKAIRLADMANVCDADLYVHSHTHLPMIMREAYHRINFNNSSVQLVDRLFVNTSATLDYGGYGQAQEFKPNSVRTPVIHLDPRKARATATL